MLADIGYTRVLVTKARGDSVALIPLSHYDSAAPETMIIQQLLA